MMTHSDYIRDNGGIMADGRALNFLSRTTLKGILHVNGGNF